MSSCWSEAVLLSCYRLFATPCSAQCCRECVFPSSICSTLTRSWRSSTSWRATECPLSPLQTPPNTPCSSSSRIHSSGDCTQQSTWNWPSGSSMSTGIWQVSCEISDDVFTLTRGNIFLYLIQKNLCLCFGLCRINNVNTIYNHSIVNCDLYKASLYLKNNTNYIALSSIEIFLCYKVKPPWLASSVSILLHAILILRSIELFIKRNIIIYTHVDHPNFILEL